MSACKALPADLLHVFKDITLNPCLDAETCDRSPTRRSRAEGGQLSAPSGAVG